MRATDLIAAVLVIVGAVNWGLFGAFRLDLVSAVFGDSILASIVYVLVGIAGVYQLLRLVTAPKHPLPVHA
jgi:uncharacterized membrane protein YuzA (DUF378 family)